jgi:hypothetical protein
MGYNIGPLTVVPGTPINNILKNAGAITAVKFTNGTQYDITFSGFGTPGTSTIPAGTEYMLHSVDGNEGYLNILPVDNIGVGGSGIVNLVVYLQGEKIPEGQWPVSIPAQKVVNPNVAGSTAKYLTNTSDPVGQGIITVYPSGASTSIITADNKGDFAIQEDVGGGVGHNLFKSVAGVAPGVYATNVYISEASHSTNVKGDLQVSQRESVGYCLVLFNATNTGDVSNKNAAQVAGFETRGTVGYGSNPQSGDDNYVVFQANGISGSTHAKGLEVNGVMLYGIDLTAMTGGNNGIRMGNAQAISMQDAIGTDRQILYTDSSNNVVLRQAGNARFAFQSPAGSTLTTMDNNGSMNFPANAGMTFASGGLLRALTTGTVSVGAAATAVVNHGISATPSCVIAVADQASANAAASCYSYTSTQFTIFNPSAGTVVFRWMAFF